MFQHQTKPQLSNFISDGPSQNQELDSLDTVVGSVKLSTRHLQQRLSSSLQLMESRTQIDTHYSIPTVVDFPHHRHRLDLPLHRQAGLYHLQVV